MARNAFAGFPRSGPDCAREWRCAVPPSPGGIERPGRTGEIETRRRYRKRAASLRARLAGPCRAGSPSKPRKQFGLRPELTTIPSFTSTRTSRSPSTRPTGEMSSVLREGHNAPLDDENIILRPARRDRLRCCGELDCSRSCRCRWAAPAHAHQCLCTEHRNPGIKSACGNSGSVQPMHGMPARVLDDLPVP